MRRALLIDLDDTLIQNDLGLFLPAYFDGLSGALADFGPKDKMLKAVLAGTRAMLENADPAKTLAQAFYGSFEQSTGATPGEVEAAIHRFYSGAYAELKNIPSRQDGAADLLRAAFDFGLTVVVATNPLMTRNAVEQRLRWAGVPPEDFAYAFITDVETFHFAKPRPAYYAETLGLLGVIPGEAVMIGNDTEEDLAPAAALGLSVFHVSSEPDPRFPGGSLIQARDWLETVRGSAGTSPLEPEALVARLQGQLASLLTRLANADAGPTPGHLSPVQVVCHLRDVDREVNLPRLEQILARTDPFFSPVDTDAWVTERGYAQETVDQAIDGMVAARLDVIGVLQHLEPEQWRRTARHALLGPITLADWVGVLAEHDLRHQTELTVRQGSSFEGGGR